MLGRPALMRRIHAISGQLCELDFVQDVMIRIAVTAEAFEAVTDLLPGNIGFEREPDDNGERLIWLEPHVVNRLRALRGPGETYSDVILKLVELEAKGEL